MKNVIRRTPIVWVLLFFIVSCFFVACSDDASTDTDTDTDTDTGTDTDTNTGTDMDTDADTDTDTNTDTDTDTNTDTDTDTDTGTDTDTDADTDTDTDADTDTAGFVIVANTVTTETANDPVTIEGFATDDMNTLDYSIYSTFTVKLRSQPLDTVTLALTSDSTTDDGIITPASLVFTTGNWDSPRTVYVEGASNGTNEGNHNYSVNVDITTSDAKYGSTSFVQPPSFSIFSCDNDAANVLVSCRRSGGFTTSENGGTATLWLISKSNPDSSVSVPVTSDNTNEGVVSGSPATIMTSNWNTMLTSETNKVTITGQDDSPASFDGNTLYNLIVGNPTSGSSTYTNFNPPDVTIRNVDNETALDFQAVSGDTTENGGSATFQVRLKTTPTADVTFTLGCKVGSSECASVSPPTLTFTTANIWQTVTITGKDDHRVDGTQPNCVAFGKIESLDPAIDEIQPSDFYDVDNLDNDKLIWITDNDYLGNFNATSNMYPIDEVCGPTASDANAPANVGSVTYKALIAHSSFRVATTSGNSAAGQVGWVLASNTEYYLKFGASPYEDLIFTTNSYGTFSFGTLTTAFSSDSGDEFWTGLNSNWTTASDNCNDWSADNGYTAEYGKGNATDSTSIHFGTASCSIAASVRKKIICVQQ